MLLAVLLASAVHAAPAPDSLTGAWQVRGDVVGNPLNEICTVTQAGAKLTGSCKNTDDAGAPAFDLTGEVREGKVTFSHGGEYQGQSLTITYVGTLAAPRALKGTVDVQPFAVNGTFTATPVAPSGAPRPAAPTPAAPAKP